MNQGCFSNFNNIGVLQVKLSQKDLEPINHNIETINLVEDSTYNHQLAGNIYKEFELKESHRYIETLINPFVEKYIKEYDFIRSNWTVIEKSKLILDKAWVNFQKKHEFNPVHNHTGLISFVIWIKIPYDIHQELECSPGNVSNENVAGHFSFLYTNSIGQINTLNIAVTKELEGTLLIFPSKLMHCVYPFYTSNDYRISVAGNYAQTFI